MEKHWTIAYLKRYGKIYLAYRREELDEGMTINYHDNDVNLTLHLTLDEIIKLVHILRQFPAIEAASHPEKES